MRTWTCNGSDLIWDGHPHVALHENENCPYCGKLSPVNMMEKEQSKEREEKKGRFRQYEGIEWEKVGFSEDN